MKLVEKKNLKNDKSKKNVFITCIWMARCASQRLRMNGRSNLEINGIFLTVISFLLDRFYAFFCSTYGKASITWYFFFTTLTHIQMRRIFSPSFRSHSMIVLLFHFFKFFFFMCPDDFLVQKCLRIMHTFQRTKVFSVWFQKSAAVFFWFLNFPLPFEYIQTALDFCHPCSCTCLSMCFCICLCEHKKNVNFFQYEMKKNIW